MKILIVVGFLLATGLLAGLVAAGIMRGWKRHGYFTIPGVVLIVIAIFFLFQFVGGALAFASMGMNFKDHNLLMLTMNALAQVLVMLLGTIMLARALGLPTQITFRLEGVRETPIACYLLAFPLILSAQWIGVALSAIWTHFLELFPPLYSLLDKFESITDKQMESLVTANSRWELLVVLLTVGVIPALCEETLFRGFAMTNIERSGKYGSRPWTALFVTSIVFASIHLSVFKLPGLFALGISLAWMAYRTNNLLVGALAHATNNGLIALMLFIVPRLHVSDQGKKVLGTADLSLSDSFIMLAVASVLFGACATVFQKLSAPIAARGYAEHDVLDAIDLETADYHPNDFPLPHDE